MSLINSFWNTDLRKPSEYPGQLFSSSPTDLIFRPWWIGTRLPNDFYVPGDHHSCNSWSSTLCFLMVVRWLQLRVLHLAVIKRSCHSCPYFPLPPGSCRYIPESMIRYIPLSKYDFVVNFGAEWFFRLLRTCWMRMVKLNDMNTTLSICGISTEGMLGCLKKILTRI